MSQIIEKVGNGQFKIYWEEKPTEIIELDFNPLIDNFNLRNKEYLLLHWQAIPMNLRRFGVYDCFLDKYKGVDYDKISFINTQCSLAQIPDSHYKKRPTAVIVYKGRLTESQNGVLTVRG